jgi:hypothetical protein
MTVVYDDVSLPLDYANELHDRWHTYWDVHNNVKLMLMSAQFAHIKTKEVVAHAEDETTRECANKEMQLF